MKTTQDHLTKGLGFLLITPIVASEASAPMLVHTHERSQAETFGTWRSIKECEGVVNETQGQFGDL